MHFKRKHWICYTEMHVAKPSIWSQLGHRARVRFSLGISYLGVYYLSLIWFRNVPNQFSIPCYPRQKRADMRSCRSLKMRAFYTIDFYLRLLPDFSHFTFHISLFEKLFNHFHPFSAMKSWHSPRPCHTQNGFCFIVWRARKSPKTRLQ